MNTDKIIKEKPLITVKTISRKIIEAITVGFSHEPLPEREVEGELLGQIEPGNILLFRRPNGNLATVHSHRYQDYLVASGKAKDHRAAAETVNNLPQLFAV